MSVIKLDRGLKGAIQLLRIANKAQEQGKTQITLRNPKTGKEVYLDLSDPTDKWSEQIESLTKQKKFKKKKK